MQSFTALRVDGVWKPDPVVTVGDHEADFRRTDDATASALLKEARTALSSANTRNVAFHAVSERARIALNFPHPFPRGDDPRLCGEILGDRHVMPEREGGDFEDDLIR